jgi:hypothetical protein
MQVVKRHAQPLEGVKHASWKGRAGTSMHLHTRPQRMSVVAHAFGGERPHAPSAVSRRGVGAVACGVCPSFWAESMGEGLTTERTSGASSAVDWDQDHDVRSANSKRS